MEDDEYKEKRTKDNYDYTEQRHLRTGGKKETKQRNFKQSKYWSKSSLYNGTFGKTKTATVMLIIKMTRIANYQSNLWTKLPESRIAHRRLLRTRNGLTTWRPRRGRSNRSGTFV